MSEIRRHTRTEYHNARKRVQQQRESIVANKMAQSLNSSCQRDFWSESKKINSISKPKPSNVDGALGDDNISSVFALKYEELYNNVSFDSDDMLDLENDQKNLIDQYCCNDNCACNHSVNYADLGEAMKFLKSGKSDVDLSTDHLINAPAELNVHLLFLFYD